MGQYIPPLRDLKFVLEELLGIEDFLRANGDAEIDAATVGQVLEAAGQFAAEVIQPLNAGGDSEGCTRTDAGEVLTPRGFKAAFEQYVAAAWPTLVAHPDYGGQGFPLIVGNSVAEILCAANMAWASYPIMSAAAYKCIAAVASSEQKAFYLPRITRGEWAGTMCLTEPHAGTDLGLLRTRAEPRADGSYRINGTKIFISGGEQDLVENIVHLVLARVEGAPPGVKGISLFIVPKFLPQADGTLGARNGVSCGSVEEKMGIHGNATCTMNFDDATGWLVGEENKGLAGMFVMMNTARISVAVAALGLMEAAYQSARAYALDREQGRAPTAPVGTDARGVADAIVGHADVRRMLLDQKANVEGCRALILWATLLADMQQRSTSADERKATEALLALVTPVVKAFVSDLALESTNLAVQVYGGHGYIRDNGVEQYVRDARIIPLYEGTNGVQAMDLINRKVLADHGQRAATLVALIQTFVEQQAARPEMQEFTGPLVELCQTVVETTGHVAAQAAQNSDAPGAAAAPYLRLIGHLLLAWLWARMAAIALARRDDGDAFYRAKLLTARYYYQRRLPEVRALVAVIKAGPQALMDFAVEDF